MIIAVGGHSRNIGKTAVLCGIISGLPELDWTAVKLTQYGHGFCSRHGEPCKCFDPARPVAFSRQLEPDGTDSGRYLAAGARQAFWSRTPAGRLAEAMPRFREVAAQAPNLIVESNSLLGLLRPDVYVMVLDGAVPDFKPSSLRFFDRATVLVPTSTAPLAWPNFPVSLLESKQLTPALAPSYRSDALLQIIRAHHLNLAAHSAD